MDEAKFSKRKQTKRGPKPERFSRKAKASADKVYALAREMARIKVFMRSGGEVIYGGDARCERCGRRIGVEGETHEKQYRSREGSPLELTNMEYLCRACHREEHG